MKKVVIIGTGIGGSAIAALLAKQGFDVTVLERNKFPGGKAASFKRDGYVCDMGVHISPMGRKGPLGEVARRVSADLQFTEKSPFMRLQIGKRYFDFPLNFLGLISKLKIVMLAGVRIYNPYKLLKAYFLFEKITSPLKPDDVDSYSSIPFKEFLMTYTNNKNLLQLLEVLCGVMFCMPVEEVSTSEFIWTFSRWVRSASTSYPKGGYGSIAEAYLDAGRKHGCDVVLDAKATKIHIQSGRVKGVTAKNKFYPADIVVSNTGIKKTLELAGRTGFNPEYVKRAEDLKDSAGAVMIKYGLDYKSVDIPMIVYYDKNFNFSKSIDAIAKGGKLDDILLYIISPTLYDPDLAPEGKHLLYACMFVPSSLSYKESSEKMLNIVEEKMRELIPEIDKYTVWKHRSNVDYISAMSGRDTGEAVGISQRFDQDGRSKPDPRTPVQGLYLVGSDAGGRGVGTEQAADSALNVYEMIVKDFWRVK